MATIILKILTLILGYGLVIGSFFLFGENIEKNVFILDIVVSCIIFTNFAHILLLPMVNLKKEEHKEVGTMGIKYTNMWTYSIATIILMIVANVYEWSFKVQIISQLSLFSLFLLGIISTLTVGEKVNSVYKKEQIQMSGKLLLLDVMTQFMEDVACAKGVDPKVVEQLNKINENVRYITPSTNPTAKELDLKFCECTKSISVLLRNTALNSAQISEEANRLERIFIQRKKY